MQNRGRQIEHSRKNIEPAYYAAWYQKHLGLDVANPTATDYFEPSKSTYMINYRVADLDRLLATLRQEGVQVEDRTEEYDYGRFAWVMELEGNRVELREPTGIKPH